jgi:uncharacterized protein YecT (DUF1311 family)
MVSGSQTAMNACEEGSYQIVARSLNHDVTLVAKAFDRTDVAEAQLAWTSYLHAECMTVNRFYYPGTVAPYEKAKCEIKLAQDRISELQPLIRPEAFS